MADSGDVQGLVLTDAHGLVLKAEGDLAAQKQHSGFFASIADKADALRDGGGDDNDEEDADAAALPVVRLETSTRVLLVTRTAGGERTLVVSKRRGLLDEE